MIRRGIWSKEYRLLNLTLSAVIARALVLLVAFPAHEGAHAVVADRLGDPTPRRAGRMTWNPIKQLDLVGSLLFLAVGFGWASTPVDPARLGRRNMALVSIAGPVANLLVAVLLALPARYVLASPTLRNMFGYGEIFPSLGTIMFNMVYLNLLLFMFNLLPLPPLDGFSILMGIVPYSVAQPLAKVGQFGPLLLFGIILLVPGFLSSVLGPPLNFLTRLLLGL
jgi:Zn-dependent protease